MFSVGFVALSAQVYSLSIMPSDVGHDAIPILSEADGNCLFRYYSTTTFCSSKLIFSMYTLAKSVYRANRVLGFTVRVTIIYP